MLLRWPRGASASVASRVWAAPESPLSVLGPRAQPEHHDGASALPGCCLPQCARAKPCVLSSRQGAARCRPDSERAAGSHGAAKAEAPRRALSMAPAGLGRGGMTARRVRRVAVRSRCSPSRCAATVIMIGLGGGLVGLPGAHSHQRGSQGGWGVSLPFRESARSAVSACAVPLWWAAQRCG